MRKHKPISLPAPSGSAEDDAPSYELLIFLDHILDDRDWVRVYLILRDALEEVDL